MNEAQRELEQRALRNVRGLVDKIDNQDLADKKAERRMAKGFVIGAIVVFVAFAALFAYLSGNQSGKTITIDQKR
jgi:hypothetical protein